MIDKKEVMKRFEECIFVFKYLPNVGPSKRMTCWPEIVYTSEEIREQMMTPLRFIPTTDQITRAEEVLTWGHLLTQEQRIIIWARASRRSWRFICIKIGKSRTQANTILNVGLNNITDFLNKNEKNN